MLLKSTEYCVWFVQKGVGEKERRGQGGIGAKQSIFNENIKEQKGGRGKDDGAIFLVKGMFLLKGVETYDEVQGKEAFHDFTKQQKLRHRDPIPFKIRRGITHVQQDKQYRIDNDNYICFHPCENQYNRGRLFVQYFRPYIITHQNMSDKHHRKQQRAKSNDNE